ncbi:class I SAM-dependent methyltransferase [Flavobacteriaceae bacterium]|nr:class I SAM-dependent methyltransferase [Flavobacteriaceae bacterium]
MKQIFKKDHKHFKVKDYIKSGDLFQLYKDNNSGIVWTFLDKNHNHEYYYSSEKYIPHKEKKGFFGFLYLFVQKIMFRYKLKNLKNHINKNKIVLDYGSGDGRFAEYLNQLQIKTMTYDPLVKKLDESDPNSYQTPENQIDTIMMWHVIEHIPDLDSSIKAIYNSIKNKGSLVIAVPNIDSFDSKHYKECWAGFDVPRHLYHFNHESLINFIEKQGFIYNYRKPLIFDSFYVSILSEKNRNNPFGTLNGLIIGLLSNLFAFFSTNYSSSFYVFTKD